MRRRLVFHGECAELVPVCRAMCCRDWEVGISSEEHATGRYDAEAVCVLADGPCTSTPPSCINRRHRLRKRADRSCVYLENDRCNIYDDRPQVCRDFLCRRGWRLVSAFPAEEPTSERKPAAPTREVFVASLRDDLTFVQHPLLKVHAVFYLRARQEVVFVKEKVGACGKFHTRDSFEHPRLEDADLELLIALFDRRENLQQVYSRFCSRSAVELTRQEFHELVWLLNKHSILLDSRNFQGMPGGIGAID